MSMEVIYCKDCEEPVYHQKRRTSKNTEVIELSCNCRVEKTNKLPYEVDGWIWKDKTNI